MNEYLDQEKHFWDLIQEDPSDLATYGVFADWINETNPKLKSNQQQFEFEVFKSEYKVYPEAMEIALRYCLFHQIYPRKNRHNYFVWYGPEEEFTLIMAKELIKHTIPHKEIYAEASRNGGFKTMIVGMRRIAKAIAIIKTKVNQLEEIIRVTPK